MLEYHSPSLAFYPPPPSLFSKQAHFVVCPKILSAQVLDKMFVQHIYRLHRVLKHITGGAIHCKILGLSTTYHSSTNGAMECTNSLIEQYLHYYVNYQQTNWAEHLPFAKVAYNNLVHSSTAFTPFKVAMGTEFMPLPEHSLAEWMDNLKAMWPCVPEALNKLGKAKKGKRSEKGPPKGI
ncbi:Tf2-1, partial [Ophiophagus hannah]